LRAELAATCCKTLQDTATICNTQHGRTASRAVYKYVYIRGGGGGTEREREGESAHRRVRARDGVTQTMQ